MRYLIISLLCPMLFCLSLKAEEWVPVSSRSSAVGGAGAAFDRGVFGAYYNPANSGRPWEDLMDLEFSTAFSAYFSAHGRSHEQLLKIKYEHNRIKDVFGQVSFDPNNPMQSATYLVDSLKLLDSWSDVTIPKGHGFTGGFRGDFGIALRNTFWKKDVITLRLSHAQEYAGWLEVDHSNFNFNVRLFEAPGWQLQSQLDQLIHTYGPLVPVSPEATNYALELIGMGYTFEQAHAIAKIIEDAGYDFSGGVSQQMLDALLYNTLFTLGDSLEGGANPIKGNKSRAVLRAVAIQEIAIGYSFNIPNTEWLSVGATLKYMRASRLSLGSLDLGGGVPQLFGTPRATQHNFGLDLGVTANTPGTAGFSVGLSVRNVNAPSFVWRDFTYRLDPQVRLSSSIYPFSTEVPFQIGFDADMNRIEHSLLDGYHTQHFGMGFEIAPNIEPITFAIRIGMSKNIGDAGEPWVAAAGLGLTFWDFTIDVGGQTSFDVVEGSTTLLGTSITSNMELSIQLSYSISFGR